MTLHANINFMLWLMINIAQDNLKVMLFKNWQMFAVFRVLYLSRYTIHFTLCYIYGFQRSIRIHTIITYYIYISGL